MNYDPDAQDKKRYNRMTDQAITEADQALGSSSKSGCGACIVFALVLLFAAAVAATGNGGSPLFSAAVDRSANSGPEFATGALPTVAGEPTTTTGAAAATTAPPVTVAPQTPQATQAPQATQPPQTQPPPQCGLPGSLSVSGANTGSVPGGGGTVTATGTSVTVSTGPLVICGAHYLLKLSLASNPGVYSQDCEPAAMTVTLSGISPNAAVSISLQTPPNACG
jgi:hypothetical protein